MSAEAWRRIGSDLAPLDLAWHFQRLRQDLVWQAWYFRYLHRCPRKLGDELGRIWRRWILCGRRGIDVRGSLATNWVGFGAAGSCVAGMLYFQHLRLDLCGRCGTFGTFIDVRGSLATNWVGFGADGSCVAGVLLSAPQARFVWQVWYFRYLHRCPRKLGDELGRIWRRSILRGRRGTFSASDRICVAGVVLSVPP